MVPTPMKRISEAKVVETISERSVTEPSTSEDVRHGRRTKKEMITPTSMAIPTVIPTKCPTPIRAKESEPPIMVAPLPNLKVPEISPAAAFIAASRP